VVGQFEGNRQLGRPRQVGEISNWIIKEIRWEGVNWINLAPDKDKWWATVNAVIRGFFCLAEGLPEFKDSAAGRQLVS